MLNDDALRNHPVTILLIWAYDRQLVLINLLNSLFIYVSGGPCDSDLSGLNRGLPDPRMTVHGLFYIVYRFHPFNVGLGNLMFLIKLYIIFFVCLIQEWYESRSE